MEITLKNLTKKFDTVTAVDHVSLTIPDGKLTGLLGPSGCGKSTLLYMLSGLTNVTEGSIFFGDRDVTVEAPDKRNIGLVFQNYSLYPHMTVEENIAFPLGNRHGKDRMNARQKHEAACRVAELVQIQDLMNRKPIIACTDPNCDTGYLAEENGYGFYCPSNSVETFVKTIDNMLNSDIRQMGEQGFQFFIDNYTTQHTFNAIMKHFD